MSKTTEGVWIFGGTVLIVDRENLAEVGRATKECLNASCEGIPHPESFKDFFAPVLKLAGVKSFSAFIKHNKSVQIEESDDGSATLIPTRNLGATEGFVQMPNHVHITLNSDEALGGEILKALALAV